MTARREVYIGLVRSRLWIPTPGFHQSSRGGSAKRSNAVCQYGLSGLATACLLGFMACHSSFLFCRGENHPNPKSGWNIDPDKPGCTMSCQGDLTDPIFLCAFSDFLSPTFATDPGVVESITRLVPVEHPHKQSGIQHH